MEKKTRKPHLYLQPRALLQSVSLLYFRHPFLTVLQQPVISSNITKEDEQAAMAAMFQAQSANWEETQEKMSQLVSPLGVFYLCSSAYSNEHFSVYFTSPFHLRCIFETVRKRFTRIREEEVRFSVEASPLVPIRTDHYPRVMFAIGVERKVGNSCVVHKFLLTYVV